MNKESNRDALTAQEAAKKANDPKMDASVLRSVEANFLEYQNCIDKLGVVLEELVRMMDLDGTGVDVYLLHYVADARLAFRELVQIIDTGCSDSSENGVKRGEF
ncbi:MAG: hypothetical protein IJ539_05385 [Prevotella sp.]|nr:hypothetical protein [Prevotella sp.]